MDIYYKSSLERKSLPSKENYSTEEPEGMDVVTAGGPRREQAFAVISRATVPFTYTKVAAVIRQSYPFHCWMANLPHLCPNLRCCFQITLTLFPMPSLNPEARHIPRSPTHHMPSVTDLCLGLQPSICDRPSNHRSFCCQAGPNDYDKFLLYALSSVPILSHSYHDLLLVKYEGSSQILI